MDVTEIPFINKVGVIKRADGVLELTFDESVLNHLKTIHATAQFSLAEIASGEILQTLFPEPVGKVVPVLMDSQIKFKKPATKAIAAYPSVSGEAAYEFKEQFKKKGLLDYP